MLEEVRTKITDEKKAGALIGRLGDYILAELLTSEDAAAKIGAEGKNLKGCAKSVTDKARQQATDGCAVIENSAVYGWVREYYGIDNAPAAPKLVSLFDLI